MIYVMQFMWQMSELLKAHIFKTKYQAQTYWITDTKALVKIVSVSRHVVIHRIYPNDSMQILTPKEAFKKLKTKTTLSDYEKLYPEELL